MPEGPQNRNDVHREREREGKARDRMFQCHCKKRRCDNYDDGSPTVKCQQCGVWTHTKCNGIPGRIKVYTCRECSQGVVDPKSEAALISIGTESKRTRGGARKKARRKLENVSPISPQTDNLVTTEATYSEKITTKSEPKPDAQQPAENAWSRFEKVHTSTTEHRKILSSNEARCPPVLSEYEQNRKKNIEKNLTILEALGIKNSIASLSSLGSPTRTRVSPGQQRKPRQQKAQAVNIPTRRSTRNGVSEKVGAKFPADSTVEDAIAEDVELFTLDEYYQKSGIVPGPWMDGHFKGWVEEEVRQRMGLAACSKDAWESTGGGTVSRKPPPGMSAKEHARRAMHQNPNGFFYRHNEPGEEQWTGNWTQEEISHFVKVAEAHGCGDKWGLFSSHIPHRVGYQCSAVYRQVIIPAGLLRDPNFKITATGVAVWAPIKGHLA
eukprot:CAMPEP_0118941742 /NCGR_PEP_ID=MMETSP1169-20130426/34537_1 /TAXON_ID=36882 /ORGANISM="Pyramimonas obovata, Strain CCMP722" /LENGTH=437 /DNA_ID=CAMNT_0006886573 /DNA_START=180 /DNA_END=1493 /DNA_ORIENTATION=-